MSTTIDYTKSCFIIMPFGKKKVGDKEIDFDFIFEQIFSPAVAKVPLPEGGLLEPRRTDKDFFSGNISIEMFSYIEYSRFALADISGLNANVFYELGVRHRAHQAGTAIFRQTGAALPFDINNIKAFDYDYQPDTEIAKSRDLIVNVLTESLKYNRLDSPVQIALAAQLAHAGKPSDPRDITGVLRDAENAIRAQDWQGAIDKYREAVAIDPGNCALRLKLGLFLKEQGEWRDALVEFAAAVKTSPNYADALREKGIAENKLFIKSNRPADMPVGEESLRNAIALHPDDYDAHASLGGVLKREAKYQETQGNADLAKALYQQALAAYRQATTVSKGHSYPLLNELKLNAKLNGKIDSDVRMKVFLTKAERSLKAKVESDPPIDPPWSFFDLAEIRLYAGDKDGFLTRLQEGLTYCNAPWQPQTNRLSLEMLKEGGVDLPGLDEGLAMLEEMEKGLTG
ncbi:MAG: tetratricopeptide repeat protein [Methylococcaceae bacterium]|jgi:tetratricopeptide (TPR) repeat protein